MKKLCGRGGKILQSFLYLVFIFLTLLAEIKTDHLLKLPGNGQKNYKRAY